MYTFDVIRCIPFYNKDNCLFLYIQLFSFIFMPVFFHLHHRLFTSPRLHFPKNKSLPVGGGWRGFSGEGASGRRDSTNVQLFIRVIRGIRVGEIPHPRPHFQKTKASLRGRFEGLPRGMSAWPSIFIISLIILHIPRQALSLHQF